jgi:poly(A) polymerase
MLKLLTCGHSVKCITQLRDEGLHHGLLPLLDVILEQPMGEKFVMLALANTDERVRQGKGISPGFLFATLLWHEVLAHWEKLKAKGESKIPALYQAMDTVLDVQAEKLAITRRIIGDIKDIWALQAALRSPCRQTPLRPARTTAFPCRLRLSAAARRIRRGRQRTGRMVDGLPECRRRETWRDADAGTSR